jgi:hypothetical protein
MHYPYLPVRALLRDPYPVVEYLRHVDVSMTVVYGTEDSIVPLEQSRAVAETAGEGTTIVEVEGADHNDLALLNGPKLIAAVADLAGRILGSS